MLLQCLGKCTRLTKPSIRYLGGHGRRNYTTTIRQSVTERLKLNGTPKFHPIKAANRPHNLNLQLIRFKSETATGKNQPKVKLKKGDVTRLMSLAKSEKLVLAGK